MDAKTLTALNGSIKKWEDIVNGAGGDDASRNCPLCKEFYVDWDDSPWCKGCPVMEATGYHGCFDTPYESWAEAHELAGRWHAYPKKIHDDDTAIAAVLELEFLRSLLPEES